MQNSLEFDVEMELRKPITRSIIKNYALVDEQILDNAVYRRLERMYPSSSQFFNKLREPEDPIDVQQRLKTQLEQLKESSSLVNLLLSKVPSGAETKQIREMLNLVESTYDLNDQFDVMQRQFYVKTARAVKSVAATRGIAPEQVVNNLRYRDEVMRIVFPKRQDAEEYFEIRQRMMSEMMEISRGFILFAKKTGRDLPPEASLMPAREVSDTLIKSIFEYRAKELDRIYSKR